jgi:hypothetical protein
MAYEILSLGDGEMLYNAFQGAALVFNPENMNKLINAGFVLGILLVCFRYLTDQEFPLRHILVGLIVYLVMFAPKDTVIIEDVYTGDVRTVANVPLGLAMPMSVVSTLGVRMTTLFETAFSTPDEASMLGGGYLDTLNTLVKLKGVALGAPGSDSDLNGDLAKSISEYIGNCVMFDLEIQGGPHEVTKESMLKSDDLWGALKTTFINRDVMVHLPGDGGSPQRSCKDAYNSINAYMVGGAYQAAWTAHMKGVLGLNDSGLSPEDKVTDAIQALNITSVNAQTFMRNALIASYLRDGASAFIERTAVEQLKFQWAGEQSVFKEFARPIMSF